MTTEIDDLREDAAKEWRNAAVKSTPRRILYQGMKMWVLMTREIWNLTRTALYAWWKGR